MSVRPADACPYRKPFTAEFNDCPTYQTRHAVVVDSNDRPLRTIWSCRHMETKQLPGKSGHYYGACQLGDAKGRHEWVQRIGPERLRNIQKLRSIVMPLAQAFVDDLAALKGRHVEAIQSSQDTSAILAQMTERGDRYLADFESVLADRPELLRAAGMPAQAVIQLSRQWVDEFISETLGRSRPVAALPDDLVASLPDSVRVFYAPS